MEPLPSQQVRAVCGCDYIRNIDGLPETRTKKSWEAYAARRAKEETKKDRFTWTPFVVWVESRNAYRISFASQPERR